MPKVKQPGIASDLGRIGVTPAKQAQFASRGIYTVRDLVNTLPKRYLDARQVTPIRDLKPDTFAAIYVKVVAMSTGTPNRVLVEDEAGSEMGVAFFGRYPFSTLETETWYYIVGKVTEDYRRWGPTMTNPMYVTTHKEVCRIIPVYGKIKGMSNRYFQEKVHAAIAAVQVLSGFGDKELLGKTLGLPSWVDAARTMHAPASVQALRQAAKRMAFEEIYDFYDALAQATRYASATGAIALKREKMDAFIAAQPFKLTADQESVIRSIVDRVSGGRRVNAIVSGDVGSGKTMVAASIAVLMAENGYQSIILAPTLVLAKQHYASLQGQLAAVGCTTALLTGETKAAERKAILSGLADGSIQVLIGTHAVILDDIQPKALGLTVVDEEHKFGTRQKAALLSMAQAGAHHLSMTATPIPRSMAMGVYGNDLDVLPIHTMPTGRKPVKTSIEPDLDAICRVISREVDLGHQAYVVCPFITDSEAMTNVWSVQTAERELRRRLPGVNLTAISGDMGGTEVLRRVDKFSAGTTQVLVSTTIVEVGVNVPNATVIAVLSADRFGLAALHQLRGRVGRGTDQAYCLLLPGQPEKDKLAILCATNDGFRIAEEDMKARGPGNLLGLEQSGANHTIDLILRYPKLSAKIRRWLEERQI